MAVAFCHRIIFLRITSVWDYMFRLQPDAHVLNKESEPADLTVECIPEQCHIDAHTLLQMLAFKDTHLSAV